MAPTTLEPTMQSLGTLFGFKPAPSDIHPRSTAPHFIRPIFNLPSLNLRLL